MDIQALADISKHAGPFVSLYLGTWGAVENAAPKFETRWKDAVRELVQAGVDEPTRQALEDARGQQPHLEGGTLVMIASRGEVCYRRSLPDAPAAEIVRVAPLPYLLPLVDWANSRIPYVLVLADRLGADILAYGDAAIPQESETVEAGRFPFHKTGKGAWSALRFEHKVQEDWKASAREVAAAVAQVAARTRARLIIAAGDVHATNGVQDALPTALQSNYRVIDGGRSRDGSDEVVAQRVTDTLADFAAAETRELLAEFAKYRDRAAKSPASADAQSHPAGELALNAADGIAATVAALREGAVRALILAEGLAEQAPLYFGPEPLHLATSAAELEADGVPQPQSGALVDVLLRAALAGAADVRLVPNDDMAPTDGVGALLRHNM